MKKFKLKIVNDTNEKANWLRAAVLGSNDGIISIAGLVIGVSEATQSKAAVITAGLAGIIAGAISLGAGEYVSVCSQRDMENALLSKEKSDLIKYPKEEYNDLVLAYEDDGMKPKMAKAVATELTESNAFITHAEVDLHIDPDHLTSPWSSVIASTLSFIIGALIPLSAIMLPVGDFTLIIVSVAVVVALSITGVLTAKLSGASIAKSTLRVVAGGVLAMIVTYLAGYLFRTLA